MMSPKSLLVVFCLLCVVIAVTQEDELAFEEFTRRYNKVYPTKEEFQRRMQIFLNNMHFIEEQNNQSLSYKLKMNQFGDLTSLEFREKHLNNPRRFSIQNTKPYVSSKALPTSWDWRDKGAVTPIKTQGQCEGWVISLVEAIEGCHQITTGTLVPLSVQQIIDCETGFCYDVDPTDAYQYIIQNGGVDSAASYPNGPNDGVCKYKKSGCASTVTNYTFIYPGSEKALQQAVYLNPVTAAVDSSQPSFQFYSSGVYYEPRCSTVNLDLGVLTVGWGVQSGNEYWIVKNSWGVNWGMQGYILMSRNKNNNCGIATGATFPGNCPNCPN